MIQNPSHACLVVLCLLAMTVWRPSAYVYADQQSQDKKWVNIGGEIYGARPAQLGPIGGGKGYTKIVTKGDYTVSTLNELLAAMEKAKSGEVVYVVGHAEIDCTVRVKAEDLKINIPEGVTLASNRGLKGSAGALIYSDEFETRPLIMTNGSNVRITGLRIRGPDPKRRMDHYRRSFKEPGDDGKPASRGHKYYYLFPVSSGIQCQYSALEVDNCELSGWSHAAVYLKGPDDQPVSMNNHIHHNYIHHNQRHGLGYGVVLNLATALIERNLFDYNRHSIAGTGRPGCGYEASHNVVLGNANGHHFDMHGGRDRKDGTNIAGADLKIHHNTFQGSVRPVAVRGVPAAEAQIHNNWFWGYNKVGEVVLTDGNTSVSDNAYGLTEPKIDPE